MYRTPPTPRDLSQPATILIRDTAPAGAGTAVEITCCVNRRRAPLVCCGRRGSPKVVAALKRGIKSRKLAVGVVTSGCLGPCNDGPNIRIAPTNSWVFGARLDDVPRILDTLAALSGAT
ncbi:MAG: (2Fe-2S) ferredoxin domain-containing protein [Alphaproteobacteria bacterium]|nr:(2Fe-2S) ferredoxin domain-containing protein [Alphaproteobacteria bacterium]